MRRIVLLTTLMSIGVVLCTICLKLINIASAAPNLPSPRISKQSVVDDFEHGFPGTNNLGGVTSCWAQNRATIDCQSDFQGSQGRLRMTYDVSASKDDYALYSSNVVSLNASDLDAVWVSLLGAEGDEHLNVELKDCGLHGLAQYPKEKVDDYLSQGITTTSWSAAVIPLTAFKAITDLTCLDQVNVLAHNNINSGQGSVLIDNIQFLPDNVLVDDFDNQDAFNKLGGFTGFWNNVTNQNYITYSYPSGELKLDYDVQAAQNISETAYWSSLQNSGLLLRKDVLTFDIRGEKGDEEVAVELHDCVRNSVQHIPKVKVSDYLPSGITTAKQKVTIPLIAFGSDVDWKCIDSLSFLASSHPWFDSERGTVYIDNLKVSPSDALPPLMIDNFNDCDRWNARLSEWSAHSTPPATFNVVASHSTGQGCAYRIDYSVVGNSGVWFFSELGDLDVSKYNFLHFAISGTVGNEEPHVYLRDKQGKERYYENIRPTQNRTEVLIPLHYFGDAISLTQVAEVRIAFEWKSMSGSVLLDDIGFVYQQQKNYLPMIANRPQTSVPVTPAPPLCEDVVPQCAFPGTYEPNNRLCSAIPLASGVEIVTEICSLKDNDDYFVITLTNKSPISIKLSNIPKGTDYDLYLYDGMNIQEVAKSEFEGAKEDKFSYTPEKLGKYYIRVYRRNRFSEKPYTLEANYQ